MPAMPTPLMGLMAVLRVVLGMSSPCFAAAAAAGFANGERRERIDAHSLANPFEVRVRHLDLDLDVNFDQRHLNGVAVIDFQRQSPATASDRLCLDTRGL